MYGGGIHGVGATAIIDSLRASGNDAHIGGAVHLQDAAFANITNSVLHGNTAQLWGGGVHLSAVAGGTIQGNTVADNDATISGGGGLYLANSPADLANNIVAFNTGGPTFANGVAYSGTAGNITCNDVFGNTAADWSGIADPTGTAGNISADPLFCDLATGKFNIQPASPCDPANSGGCGLIGALPGGCGLSPVPGGGAVPLAFRVDQNFPNPFNPQTTIRFELPKAAPTRVTIFDVAGRHVKTIVDEEMAARVHEVTWSGDDDKGRQVAAGVYFYMVSSGNDQSVGRMALVK
jgi:parallel beta-helix repeat protein